MRTLIVGYGNPLRGDDAFGWRVTERLRELVTDGEVEILTLHQLVPELMDALSHADRAIFIDAAAGGSPGEIVERVLAPADTASSFTHQATPEALLTGAQILYGHAPEAVMISVAGAEFALGAELSEPVSAQVEQVVSRVLNGLRF